MVSPNVRSAPHGLSVLDHLEENASSIGWEDAVSFRSDFQLDSLSYAQLAERSRRWARVLQLHVREGDRVLITLPAGLDFVTAFYACLYAGAIAVPLARPRGNEGRELLRKIEADCQPALHITCYSLGSDGFTPEMSCEELDDGNSECSGVVRGGNVTAVLQYTSGSTGMPRGVVVTHGNLVANSAAIRECFEHTRDSHAVMWLPHHHDMGLVGGVVHPIVEGFRVTLMCPWKFIQKPVRWLRTIYERKGTTSGGPTFAFAECVKRISREELQGLDLSTWDVAFVGAEVVRPAVLRAFGQQLKNCRFDDRAFLPCYGLAESTLLVTGVRKGSYSTQAEHDGPPDCGRPSQASVMIVDPATGAVKADGEEGEVWVSSPSVTQGYWNSDSPNFSVALEGHSRNFMRTGDLGVMTDGNLAITGRLKDLIIVRGANFHPNDLENTANESSSALWGQLSAAFSVNGDASEEVVLVQELEADLPLVELRSLEADIRQRVLAVHGVVLKHVCFVRARSLPRTSSGKVRRGLVRSQFLAHELRSLQPRKSSDAIRTAHV